jgi:phospholipid/cholesterol/gamma-HCH transport system substrate-binding protein
MVQRIFTHRVLGLIFIGLLVFGVWLVNAVFSQTFLSFDKVGLHTDTVGLNLPERADVKVRGVLVGEVLAATPGANGAELTLGIKPDKIGQIPSNVTASILPKTLFGEKYVELNIPAAPNAEALHSGSKITQTAMPVEVEQVLNDIYPLLRTVQPAELNYTLNAIATALEGRGAELGNSIVTLDNYLKRLNPQVPQFVDDIKKLSSVSSTYADVVPEIAATLRNTVKTGNTLVSRQAKLHDFLNNVTAFSNTSKQFLDANGDNIIQLGTLAEPQLALLKRYSPTFPCFLKGITNQAPLLASTFRGFVFHISLETLPAQPRGYTAADKQVYGGDPGPNCAGLPNHPVTRLPNLNDGVNNLGRGDNQRTAPDIDQTQTGTNSGFGGTQAAKDLIDSLTAPVLGVPIDQVGDITTLLFGPLAAGTKVSVG